jgi:hypothetical protein
MEQKSLESEVFGYLNRQLHKFGLEGNVISILVHNRKKDEFYCYGKIIEKENIISRLNLNTPKEVSYPNIEELSSYREGCFIFASDFMIKEKKTYVALVDISFSGTAEVFPYPR